MSDWPFDPSGCRNEWRLVAAEGFPGPVPGCVYDGARLDGAYVTLEQLSKARAIESTVLPDQQSD